MLEAGFLTGITRLSSEIGSAKHRKDDDLSDRFNHSYTTVILMFCTLISLSRQYVGKPMACFVPSEFTSSQVEYVESMCWTNSTYYVPPNVRSISTNITERHANRLLYYQWIPFILMLQAIMFAFPCIFWRMLNWQSRVHLWTIMDLALKSQAFNESFETQSDQIYFIVRHLEDALFMRHRKHFQNYYKKKRLEKLSKNLTDQTSPQDLRPISLNESIQGSPEIQEKVFGPIYSELKNRKHVNTCSSKSSSFLVALYLITKALYLLNSLGQIFFMYRYLNAKSLFFGFSIIYRSLWLGTDWVESGAFPRITLCDLDLRRFGSNIHTLTVQCVLSGNMFNEKIYVFLWFWILAVSFINLFSFLKWIYRCSIENSRIQFVGELLVERRVLSPSVLNDHYDYNTDQQAKKDEQSQNNTTQMKSTILNSKKSKNLKSPSPLPPAQINIADSPFCLRSENMPLSITKESDKKLLRIFTEYVLGQDGVLVLRFISSNVSRMVASKVVETIWNRFRIKYNNKLLATQQKAQQSLPKIPDRNNSVEYQDFPSSSENGLKKLFIDENRLIQRRSRNLFKSPLSTTTTVSSTSSENLIISDN